MRILHIEDRFHPEMGYQINIMAKFHNPENDFIILTSDSLSLWKVQNEQEFFKKSDKHFEEKNSCKIVRLHARRAKGTKYNIWIKALKRKIYELNPDVIYVHAMESITALRILSDRKLITKYNLVTDTHFLYNQIHRSIKFKLFDFLQRLLVYRKINKFNIPVFYTAEENKDILLNQYHIKSDLIHSCLIGTDLQQYYFSENDRISFRKKFHFNENSTVLLYAGKHNHLKAPHLILEAMKKVEHEVTDTLHLVFLGARDEKYFDTHMNPTFKNSKIHFHYFGVVPSFELYAYYSMSDFVVFPKENTLSALDAQACKRPVILENDMTNRERAKHGGLVYDRDNLRQLGLKIVELLNDDRFRIELGERGLQYVKKYYDYRKIIAQMEDRLYKLFEHDK
ncbi:MAG: glycosyltransferase [Bacteroidetes bacterium]|jgi:glycosyltransferase involved in cell wall biosynthesis|nr:glycosyltransferase [Bacteroidota bacterium]